MSTKNVFKLNDVHDRVVAGTWITYDASLDPGTLWTWGDNCCGVLGFGSLGNVSSPIQIPGNFWKTISGQSQAAAGIKDDGTLWTWGRNDRGQLGVGFVGAAYLTYSPRQVPGTQWCAVARTTGAYPSNLLAIKTDGTLWSSGNNICGSLGDDTIIHRSSPVQIPGTQWVRVAAASAIGSGPTFRTTSHGIKSDNTLWGWGIGSYLGHNSAIDRSSPVQIPGNSWCFISSGELHTFGLKTDGTLWAWGRGDYGRLGDSTSIPRSSPIQIPGNSWVEIGAGGRQGFGRKSDGTLWAWGNNTVGQLGLGDRICRSSPVQIPGTTWNQVSGGSNNTIARKTDRTLWTWGRNYSGELGVNSATNQCSPVQVPGTNWIDVSGGAANFARKIST